MAPALADLGALVRIPGIAWPAFDQTQLEKSAADMITQINGAIAAVDSAQGDADRANAKSKLAALQRQQYEMQQQIAKTKAAADLAERRKGVKISKECLDNPLAKGCQ